MYSMNFSRVLKSSTGIIFLGCTLLFSCKQNQPSEIRIGVLATLKGDPQTVEGSGKTTINAVKLAAKEINKSGGFDVGGKKYIITLYIEDDCNNSDGAVLAARKLAARDNVVALIGPQYSKNAIPVAELAETLKIPMISPMSTNPKTTAGKKYVFRMGYVDSFQGKVLAKFAFETLKAAEAAVLYNISDDYNRGLAETFKEAFIQAGGKIAAYESYTTDAADYRNQFRRIRDLQPDVLLLPNLTADIIPQVEQARGLGITATILFGDGLGVSQVTDKTLLENSFQCLHWHPGINNPKSLEFVKAYKKAYGKTPNNTAALSYDALRLLVQAMQIQGNTDPLSIQKGITTIEDFEGVSGVVSFKGTNDPLKSAVIIQIKNGAGTFYKKIDP